MKAGKRLKVALIAGCLFLNSAFGGAVKAEGEEQANAEISDRQVMLEIRKALKEKVRSAITHSPANARKIEMDFRKNNSSEIQTALYKLASSTPEKKKLVNDKADTVRSRVAEAVNLSESWYERLILKIGEAEDLRIIELQEQIQE